MAPQILKYIPRGSIWFCPLIIIASDLVVNGMSSRKNITPNQKQNTASWRGPPSKKEVPKAILHRLEEFMKK